MNITTTWPIGQFLTTIRAEIDEANIPAALANALKHEGQRNPAIDKVLGGFETVDGKSKRRAEYKRNDVEYSDDLALAIAGAQLKFLTSAKEGETPLFKNVEVDLPTKYEGAAGKEPAYAAEKRAVGEYLAANGGKLSTGASRTVETFAANRQIEPATVAPWQEDTEFLVRVKAWMKALATQGD